jgi:hypothetical protein
MTDIELEVIGASEVIARLAGVDSDHLGDVGVVDQALHDQRTPPPGHPGDEYSSLSRSHLYLVCITSV